MTFIHRPSKITSTSIMSINPLTFAELISEDKDSYLFNFTINLSLTNKTKKVQDYDRIVITVKTKENENELNVANDGSSNDGKLKNSIVDTSSIEALKPNKNALIPKMSPQLSNKVFSGIKMIKDSQSIKNFLSKSEFIISSQINDVLNNVYFVGELFAPDYKPKRKLIKNNLNQKRNATSIEVNDYFPFEASNIDASHTISRINSELCDITDPITDINLSKFTSETDLDDPNLKSKNQRFKLDVVKYFLDEIQPSPNETNSTWYEFRELQKSPEKIPFDYQVSIKKENAGSNLTIIFDLYKKDSTIPDETNIVDLNVPNHVEAFGVIMLPPKVILGSFNSIFNSNYLTIEDLDKTGNIVSYNVYKKNIDRKGVSSNYIKLFNVSNSNTIIMCSITLDSKLSVIRIVPVDTKGRESNVFTNVIAGEGYESIGTMSIAPIYFEDGVTKIQIYNIPKNTSIVNLYRRDCTLDGENARFQVVFTGSATQGTSFLFPSIKETPNHYYEYFAEAETFDIVLQKKRSITSNYVMKKCSILENPNGISVFLSNQQVGQLQNGLLKVSFQITTEITPEENQSITDKLKNGSLSEIYNQLLDPANNNASPLGETKGALRYADLFIHEVVRINTSTSEREIFSLVPDGLFSDDQNTQKINGILPINPQHEYVYCVYTYRKDPIELLKNYVAVVIPPPNKGRQWFYSPYKWKSIKGNGYQYPEDENGFPKISEYENLTSSPYGMTATFKLDGSRQFTKLSKINVERIDRNTNKITWNFEGSSIINKINIYDSFVVMKVVNGIRSFVGRTFKNFIYHDLTKEDLGSVYYIIVPIMAEFDMDDPGYSEVLFIGTDGIIAPKKSITVKNYNELSFSLN